MKGRVWPLRKERDRFAPSAANARLRPMKTQPEVDESAKAVLQAWNVQTNVAEWVKHAESKLGAVLAFLGALTAGLINLMIKVGRPSRPMMWLEGLAAAPLFCALVFAVWGLRPRFSKSQQSGTPNPLYYGDIGRCFNHDVHGYSVRLRNVLRDPEELMTQLSQQVVANSIVAVRKYKMADRAALLGLAALLGTAAVACGLALGW